MENLVYFYAAMPVGSLGGAGDGRRRGHAPEPHHARVRHALLDCDRTDEHAAPALKSLQLVVQLGSFRTGQQEVRDEGYATLVLLEQVLLLCIGPGHHDTKA